MPEQKKLSDMLDNLIDSNQEQAQMDFHDYLQDKIRDIVQPELPVHDVTNNEE